MLITQKINDLSLPSNDVELAEVSPQHLKGLKQKIFEIQQQKTELVCQAIKMSTKLMSRLVNELKDQEKETVDKQVLTKVKLFLKITRLVVDNSQAGAASCQGKQKEFFATIQIYTEKIQSQLYDISNGLLKSFMTANKEGAVL